MSIAATVLLVEAEQLPDRLSELLEKKSVFVEGTSRAELRQALPTITPDVVVASSSSAHELLDAVEGQSHRVPVILLASRQEHEQLRAEFGERIAAFVPKDLPGAALAHRVATMARRSAQGEPLQKTPSLVPAGAARRRDSSKPATQQLRVQQDGAADPMGAAVVERELRRRKHQSEAAPSARGVEQEPAPRAVIEEEVTHQDSRSSAKSRAQLKDEADSDSDRQRLARQRQEHAAAVKKQAQDKAREARERAKARQQQRRQEARAVAARAKEVKEARAAKESAKEPEAAGQSSAAPPRASSGSVGAFDKTVAQQVSPFAKPAPSTASEADHQKRVAHAERMARAHRGQGVADAAVRVALIDDDMTRADALARELREHGIDVMLLSPVHEQARWPVVRRFAPHGLIVDERSLSKGGRTIVGAFRRDPFLQYVPLVAARFDRLYKEDRPTANLHPVMPHLQPLGREELGLVEQLGSGKKIKVDLSEILPSRLIELLADHGGNYRLTCASVGQTLVWPIADGLAGGAEISTSAGDSQHVDPGKALFWLLEQEEPKVVVAQKPVDFEDGVPVHELLEHVTNDAAPPAENSMMLSMAALGSLRPQKRASARPPMQSIEEERQLKAERDNLEELDVEELAPQESRYGPTGTVRAPERTSAPPLEPAQLGATDRWGHRARSASTALSQRVERALAWGRGQVARAHRDLPPWAFWSLAGLIPFVLVLALFVVFGGNDASGPAHRPKVAATPEPEPKPAPVHAPAPQPKPEPVPEPPAAERWKVVADSELTNCMDLVGASAASESPGKAGGYWTSARAALVKGNADEAHEYMCRSALIEPAGPASLGLAEYYLSRRSLDNAEHWAQKVLALDPDDRRALEVQADIFNQRGEVDRSREMLLDTMKLEGDETGTINVIVRKFLADAKAARKSGDQSRAERVLRRAAMLEPENLTVATELAEVLLHDGLRDAARAWVTHALTLDRDLPEAHLIAADIAREEQDFAEARKHYEAIPKEHGSYGTAQERLTQLPD